MSVSAVAGPNGDSLSAQAALPATTLTAVLTSPIRKAMTVKAGYVCNRDAGATTFRLSFAPAGAADAVEQYLYYDSPIGGNATVKLDIVGLPLSPGDVLRAYAGTANLSVNIFAGV